MKFLIKAGNNYKKDIMVAEKNMQIPAAIHLKLHPNKWQKVNKQEVQLLTVRN